MSLNTQPKLGISMPVLNQPMSTFAELAVLADRAGFDSVWNYEFFRNPFVMHATAGSQTRTIQHATGIASSCGRSPFEMANAAADLDEITGGRTILGFATGGGGWTDVYNGADISHPLPRIREYVQCLRAIWQHYSEDGAQFTFEGRFHSAASPQLNPWGVRRLVRPRVPIYLGAVQPKMLQLAGEIADGVLNYLVTPDYLRDTVHPNIARGAQKAGRDPSDIDHAALLLCSVSDDREEAIRRARINVGNYICFPGAEAMVASNGLTEIRDQVLAKLLTDGPSAFDLLPEDVVKIFAICGTPDEGREQLKQFDGLLSHIVLHTPYVPPLSQHDSEDCYRNTIAAFGPGATPTV